MTGELESSEGWWYWDGGEGEREGLKGRRKQFLRRGQEIPKKSLIFNDKYIRKWCAELRRNDEGSAKQHVSQAIVTGGGGASVQVLSPFLIHYDFRQVISSLRLRFLICELGVIIVRSRSGAEPVGKRSCFCCGILAFFRAQAPAYQCEPAEFRAQALKENSKILKSSASNTGSTMTAPLPPSFLLFFFF